MTLPRLAVAIVEKWPVSERPLVATERKLVWKLPLPKILKVKIILPLPQVKLSGTDKLEHNCLVTIDGILNCGVHIRLGWSKLILESNLELCITHIMLLLQFFLASMQRSFRLMSPLAVV